MARANSSSAVDAHVARHAALTTPGNKDAAVNARALSANNMLRPFKDLPSNILLRPIRKVCLSPLVVSPLPNFLRPQQDNSFQFSPLPNNVCPGKLQNSESPAHESPLLVSASDASFSDQELCLCFRRIQAGTACQGARQMGARCWTLPCAARPPLTRSMAGSTAAAALTAGTAARVVSEAASRACDPFPRTLTACWGTRERSSLPGRPPLHFSLCFPGFYFSLLDHAGVSQQDLFCITWYIVIRSCTVPAKVCKHSSVEALLQVIDVHKRQSS